MSPPEKKAIQPQVPPQVRGLMEGLGLKDVVEQQQEIERQAHEHAQEMDRRRTDAVEASVELQERHVKATERIADALEGLLELKRNELVNRAKR